MGNNQLNSLKSFGNDKGKDTKLTIECTLLGGILPMFEIWYQNRKLTGFFNKSIWNNKKAIEKMAIDVIEQQHIINPFKFSNNG